MPDMILLVLATVGAATLACLLSVLLYTVVTDLWDYLRFRQGFREMERMDRLDARKEIHRG